MTHHKKLVVVGDFCSGKTSLVNAHRLDDGFLFGDDCHPRVIDMFVENVQVNTGSRCKRRVKEVELTLCDTPGSSDYDQLRVFYYTNTDVIVICFSIGDPQSLQNVVDKWWPEVVRYCQDVPIILVGNMKDLRNDQRVLSELRTINREPVSEEEGRTVAERIRAHSYLECSAKKKDGIHKVFDTATRASFRIVKRRRGCLNL